MGYPVQRNQCHEDKKAKNILWSGKVDETILLFNRLKKKAAQNLCNYLEKHLSRIIDYQYYQLESVSSIGSGSIESVIKRIGTRIKNFRGSIE